MSVANESSPRTRSDASRGDGGAAAHRHGDVGAVERRGVVHAVAGDGDDPVVGARGAHEPALLLGRRAGDDVERRQLAGEPVVVPAASSSPVTMRSASRPASPAIVAAVTGWSPVTTTTWMPAPPRRRHRVGDARPDRVGEADEGTHLARARHRPAERGRRGVRRPAADASMRSAQRRRDRDARRPRVRRRTRGRPRGRRARGSRRARPGGPASGSPGSRLDGRDRLEQGRRRRARWSRQLASRPPAGRA